MEFKQTFNREFLRTAYERTLEQQRIQAITRCVEQVCGQVLQSANIGKTQHTIEMNDRSAVQISPYIPSTQELIDAFRLKFPDCRVEYGETWEPSPRNPNQMNKKSGIIIDWS